MSLYNPYSQTFTLIVQSFIPYFSHDSHFDERTEISGGSHDDSQWLHFALQQEAQKSPSEGHVVQTSAFYLLFSTFFSKNRGKSCEYE